MGDNHNEWALMDLLGGESDLNGARPFFRIAVASRFESALGQEMPKLCGYSEHTI